jgi:hypothetical protein
MLLNEYKRNFFRLLNEGAAEMYRDSYYPEVDDYILEKIIEIDPESNGDDLSDFGKLLLKLNPQMSDFGQLRKDIEIFAKAVRNGAEVPDVKTVEELHYAAVDLANSNAHMSGDEVNAQEESLGCPTVYSDGEYRVIDICNKDAAAYYGKGTMWIWGANDGNMFDQYSQRGKIYVILKGSEKFSAIRMGSRLRITDAQDENVSKDMFPQEMLTALTGVNESKNVRLSENELMNMLVEAVEKKMNRKKCNLNENDYSEHPDFSKYGSQRAIIKKTGEVVEVITAGWDAAGVEYFYEKDNPDRKFSEFSLDFNIKESKNHNNYNMAKIKLTESELKKMISEAVKRSINEIMTGGPLRFANDIVYGGEDWVIVKPSCWESSCVYGNDTQWCISSKVEDHKRFWDMYSENGEFYFLINKNGNRKYALYFGEDGENTFLDATNNDIEMPVLSEIGVKEDGVYEYFDSIHQLEALGDDAGYDSELYESLSSDDVDDYDYDMYVK